MSVTLEHIEARIKEYETAITNSASNHNSLLGGLAELKNMLTAFAPVVEAIDPEAAPVVEAVESVVDAIAE